MKRNIEIRNTNKNEKVIIATLNVKGLKSDYIDRVLIEDLGFSVEMSQFVSSDYKILKQFSEYFGIKFEDIDDNGTEAYYEIKNKQWFIMLEIYPEDDEVEEIEKINKFLDVLETYSIQ